MVRMVTNHLRFTGPWFLVVMKAVNVSIDKYTVLVNDPTKIKSKSTLAREGGQSVAIKLAINGALSYPPHYPFRLLGYRRQVTADFS